MQYYHVLGLPKTRVSIRHMHLPSDHISYYTKARCKLTNERMVALHARKRIGVTAIRNNAIHSNLEAKCIPVFIRRQDMRFVCDS